MIILLSNDDGIEARGLEVLQEALHGLGELWVVAPATEQSARSHAFTMDAPLRVEKRGERRFAVGGTPADAVYLGLHRLLPRRPDLVVSGVNRGANLSTDVYYSGTVAAAREALGNDIPAVAVSLMIGGGPVSGEQAASGEGSPGTVAEEALVEEAAPGDGALVERVAPQWETARVATRRVIEEVVREGLPPRVLLNVNVPAVPVSALKGYRTAPAGRRYYHPLVKEGKDPRGRSYYWIGGDHHRFDDEPGSDGPVCADGWVSITPLTMNLTAEEWMPDISRRFDQRLGDARPTGAGQKTTKGGGTRDKSPGKKDR